VGSSISGLRQLRDLTVEELGELLEHTGFKKVRPVFAENEISGSHVCYCEDFEELMSEDFGVTSKPIAKRLMDCIADWKIHGVQL
jgi:hypothetical protein